MMRDAKVLDDSYDRVEPVKLRKHSRPVEKPDRKLLRAKLYSKNVNELAKMFTRRQKETVEPRKTKVFLTPIV